jgi:hypothetical protein
MDHIMPEFQLNTEDSAFEELDELTQGYIECLFFQNQCTTGVSMTLTGDGVETRWLDVSEVEEPGFIKAHWKHPEIQAAIEEGQSDGTVPADAGVADLSPESLADIKAHVAAWYEKNRELADAAADLYGMHRVGVDLHFTESGAGAGFWDREELEEDGLGDKLSEATDRHEAHLYYDAEADVIHVE